MKLFSGVILTCALFAAASAVPYSKYGRTCRDIGCRSNEECVMVEDPCTSYQRDQCGRYPTCRRRGGSESCSSKICPTGQYCRTVGGQPTCVDTVPGAGYDSAGISSINGQPTYTSNNNQPVVPPSLDPGSRYAGSNPYGGANAPPFEDVSGSGQNSASNYPPYPTSHHSSSGSNGYPAYPPSPNNGYPSYPSNQGSRTDQLGYPPYPNNKNHYQAYPNYPQSYNPGGYAQQYPDHHGGNSYGYKGRGSARAVLGSATMVLGMIAVALLLGSKRFC